jgi:hypothetical protein
MCPFIWSGRCLGGREWRVAAVIGTFMAAVTRSEGGGNYSRLRRGELLGGLTVGGSVHGRRRGWCERRRRWRSAGAVREEERSGEPRRLKGRTCRWVARSTEPKFEGKLFL